MKIEKVNNYKFIIDFNLITLQRTKINSRLIMCISYYF